MNLAVLILSYQSPESLAHLSEYFGSDARLFAHVDLKAEISKVQIPSSITLVKRRRVHWGGWSMIQAEMSLLKTARLQEDFDSYILLSDDSCPLFPIGTMLKQLAEAAERIWIWTDVPDWCWRRYNGFYHYDSNASCPRHMPPEDREVGFEDLESYRALGNLMLRGKKPIRLCHGPQWWGLSRDAVERVLHAYEYDDWLRESFQFSAVPDEHYIQTVLGGPSRGKFMYTERNREVKPWVFRARADLLTCNLDGFLFVRKVDASIPEMEDLMRTGNLY